MPGICRENSIKFSELKAKVYFLVFGGVLTRLLIAVPEIEKLIAHIDLSGQYADFTIGKSSVLNGLEPDRAKDPVQGDGLEDEDLTIYSSVTLSVEVSEDESKKDMVVFLAMEVGSESNQNDIAGDFELKNQNQTVVEELSRLQINEHAEIEELLYSKSILATSFHDLRSADVPVQHSFQPEGGSSI